MLFAAATSFGGVWALAVLAFRGAPRFVRATAVLVPLVVVNLLTSSDWDRVLTFAWPVVIPLACRIRLRWPVLGALLVTQAALSGVCLDRIWGYYHFVNHRHTLLIAMLLSTAVVLALVGTATRRRPRPSPSSFATAPA